jgi:hypothetical protein
LTNGLRRLSPASGEWRYFSYGLRILADSEIEGVSSCPGFEVPDVRIWLNRVPPSLPGDSWVAWYRSPHANQRGNPNLVIWRARPGGSYHFAYDDGPEFRIAADGREVWCRWTAPASAADAEVYLRGPVLGFVLRLQGILCLHASAVAVGQQAVALAGAAGAGKSTTAAGLVKLGFRLLADDATALRQHEDGIHVWPGHPRLNLWPDSASALYGAADHLPRLTPADGVNHWWDKRYVDLDREREFQRTPLPLAAVYVLGARIAAGGAPRIEPITPRDALMTLVEETYVSYALDGPMRAEEFRALAGLVRSVPVRRVTAGDDRRRLLDLCEAVVEDLGDLTASAGGRA